MTSTAAEQDTPAYVSWTTFTSYVGRMKDSGSPPRIIDSTVMPGMSGGTQSQLRGALQWLGYTNNAGTTNEKLRELVQAHGTDQWKPTLARHLNAAYKRLVDGIDLSNTTMAELRTKFREGGANGSVLEKAVRFYLSGLKEAEVAFSPYLSIRGAMSTGGPRRPRARSARVEGPGGSAPASRARATVDEDLPDSEPIRLRLPGKGEAVLYLPTDITESEWGIIDMYVKGYIKLHEAE